MSLEKTLEVNNLIDMYGEFLTEKQLAIMNDYFKFDYSLSEIADNLNITKQAVKYSIGLALDRLREIDSKLNLLNLKEKLNKFLLTLEGQQKDDLQQIINMLGE